jgi:hypothetical protein
MQLKFAQIPGVFGYRNEGKVTIIPLVYRGSGNKTLLWVKVFSSLSKSF